MAAELEQGHDQIWADNLAGQNMARDIWMNSPWVRDRQERSRALMQVTSSAHWPSTSPSRPGTTFPFSTGIPFIIRLPIAGDCAAPTFTIAMHLSTARAATESRAAAAVPPGTSFT